MSRPAPADAAPLTVLLLAHAAAFVAAAAGSAVGVLIALVATGIADAVCEGRPTARSLLATAGVGPVTRSAVRLLPLVLLAGRETERSVLVAVGVTAALVVAFDAVRQAAEAAVRWLRRPPLLSRNLDLGDFQVPAAPGAVWGAAGVSLLAAPLLALALALSDGDYDGWAEAGLGAATVLALAPALRLAIHAVALRRSELRTRSVTAVTEALDRLRPQVAVYFAASPEEVYQADMWLAPVEQLDRPAVVLLRDPDVLARLADTDLPVVCSRHNGTLAGLPLPDPIVTLFPTHSGSNVAMLRRRETRRVFVGHGDSDKPDSTNPYARVYDEIWVAGPLGRRRYHDGGVSVADTAIVEIGRPQAVPPDAAPPARTVLYAPTWEGWGDDPHHSSLPHAGPALVEALLQTAGVRVLYRPHPLTGRRDPALRRAHHRVIELLRDAGAVAPTYAEARPRGTGDLLDRMVTSSREHPSRDALAAERAAAVDRYWAAAPTAHRIVDAQHGPSLSDCFGQASTLIADVSSVVTEFLVTDRPYAVIDTRGLGAAALRQRHPSTAGGFVLGPDLSGLTDLVASIDGPDPTASARHALVTDSLGVPATAQQRFGAAVDRLLTSR
jgi:hypothetical protein